MLPQKIQSICIFFMKIIFSGLRLEIGALTWLDLCSCSVITHILLCAFGVFFTL